MKKLSKAQIRMLTSARDHGDPYARVFGAARAGGAHGTFTSLVRRGLLTPKGEITMDGLAAIPKGIWIWRVDEDETV